MTTIMTYSLSVVAALLLISACTDYETYGDKKKKERKSISEFISDSAFNIITETQFNAQGNTTDVSKREFVLLDKSKVYMQIVRKGCGTPIADGENVNLLCRFYEMNIQDTTHVLYNSIAYVFYVDKMNVRRAGSTYTASFTEGKMMDIYGSTVPEGWMVPLPYINVGRPENLDDETAYVRLIVPHSQGTSDASSSVYPCSYEITYERES